MPGLMSQRQIPRAGFDQKSQLRTGIALGVLIAVLSPARPGIDICQPTLRCDFCIHILRNDENDIAQAAGDRDRCVALQCAGEIQRVIACAAIEDQGVEICVGKSAQFNVRRAGFITEDGHFAWIGLREG